MCRAVTWHGCRPSTVSSAKPRAVSDGRIGRTIGLTPGSARLPAGHRRPATSIRRRWCACPWTNRILPRPLSTAIPPRSAKGVILEIDRLLREARTVPRTSIAGQLHDIGKLGVYENILNKPGALTEKEWEIVKSHPEVGANIIKNMKFLEAACDLVRHHHQYR